MAIAVAGGGKGRGRSPRAVGPHRDSESVELRRDLPCRGEVVGDGGVLGSRKKRWGLG